LGDDQPELENGAELEAWVEVAPGTKRMSDQLASSPLTKSSRAGMLVTKVPMNNQPKTRPVRRTSTEKLRSLLFYRSNTFGSGVATHPPIGRMAALAVTC